MNPRAKVLTGAAGERIVLEPYAWEGVNRSGWIPTDDKVLVMPDRVRKHSIGGIELPDEAHEKEQLRIEYGVIVAVGAGAFSLSGDRVRVWVDDETSPNRKPKPGDHVFMERYAGQLLSGNDGLIYRLLDDKCIGGIEIAEPSTEN